MKASGDCREIVGDCGGSFAFALRFHNGFSVPDPPHPLSACFHVKMPKAYGSDFKWRIVYLFVDGYSYAKIARCLVVSRGLVRKVVRFYKRWGCVENPFSGQRGRRTTLNYHNHKVHITKNCHCLPGTELDYPHYRF